MLRLFKTWLILLLITVVPLQAAAAGAMLLCAPLASAHASPGVTMAAACQHHAAQSAAVPDSASKTPEEEKAPVKHPACGACSSFCLGALMPSSPALPAAAVNGAEHAAISIATLLTGFIPDGPRRPPRTLSA